MDGYSPRTTAAAIICYHWIQFILCEKRAQFQYMSMDISQEDDEVCMCTIHSYETGWQTQEKNLIQKAVTNIVAMMHIVYIYAWSFQAFTKLTRIGTNVRKALFQQYTVTFSSISILSWDRMNIRKTLRAYIRPYFSHLHTSQNYSTECYGTFKQW
jgi:hypothetical protein